MASFLTKLCFLFCLFSSLAIVVVPQTHAQNSVPVAQVESAEPNASEEPIITAENYAFDDASQRRVFLDLTAVLRCPMCQNQNIADSDAMIAHDMRRKVYQLLKQGKSKDDVIAFMKERYGDFVYYQPPVTPVTIWLWVLPVIFAFVMMLVFILRRKPTVDDDIQDKIAAANKLLKDE
ncbi:cytochrome c-type biogenesis protein CcmH [Glaciecola sp. MH2013]|uniref:cytochrome c-type biogenesis protein n=1 Tax=Glaciecola sp. MH2013 TaxID=2785524 RepID=UPI00189E7439|nr:cytochrome c-type biogenesis protein CcmH [Glaciecola sp. MH2013]